MSDINDIKNKATARAKECADRLKNVDWKAKGEEAKAKAKELMSKENIDKAKNSVKDGIESLKTAEGRQNVKNAAVADVIAAKNKVVATWNSGPKGKAICVGVVAGILWIGSCISGGSLSDDEDCKIDYQVTLTGAASQNFKPETGVGYVSIGGFTVAQYLPAEGAALVQLSNNGLSNLAALMSGNVNGISESSDIGNLIYIKTSREYTDGQSLASGVYIYEGIVTYETTEGGSKSVKAFREMDEEVAKRRLEEDRKRRLEEEERNAKPVEGYTIPLPKTALVKSICGLEFGRPPAEIEKCLGKRVDGRPISEKNDSATFKLKKPFRLCDRVKVTYYGEPPFMVLSSVEFMGDVDKDKVSALSCKEEVGTVSKMLCEHFKFKYEGDVGENNGYYKYNFVPKWEGRIDVNYDTNSGLFTIKYHSELLQKCYDSAKSAILKKVKDGKESNKKSVGISADEGADQL